jgi:hypothetical protein
MSTSSDIGCECEFTFSQTGLTTSRLAKNGGAAVADNDALSMAENSGDLNATYIITVKIFDII